MVEARDYLGKGLSTPFRIDAATGAPATESGAPLVKESIGRILGTSVGSRIMNRTFGSTIQNLIFAPLNERTIMLIVSEAERSIKAQEPRVSAVSASIRVDGATLYIEILYTLINSNTVNNEVYPFNIEGGV